MKRIFFVAFSVLILAPLCSYARGIEESSVEAGGRGETYQAPTPPPQPARPSRVLMEERRRRFRAGIIGPGLAAVNKGPGAMMTMGVEGEYFFFDRLSAGMQMNVATEFDDHAILNFLPFARYVFDLHNHPRWSVYVQGGVGVALYNAKHAAADIAIPGGGFWWQWTDRWSVGADSWFHILVRGETAVGFTLAPAIRYQF